MQITTFVFNPFQENTYLLFDETKECIIIDAGCYDKEEEKEISIFIEDNNLILKFVLNTHCHIDHVLGVNFLKKKYEVDFIASEKDEYLLTVLKETGNIYGIKTEGTLIIDKKINQKEILKFGNTELKVIEVPGHTTGHLAFYNQKENCIFTGDVLFKGSIGRTDLPGGNYDELISSIKNKILILPDDCTVYPGHGASTTISFEKMNNPFL